MNYWELSRLNLEDFKEFEKFEYSGLAFDMTLA